jgi:hypothetical protein
VWICRPAGAETSFCQHKTINILLLRGRPTKSGAVWSDCRVWVWHGFSPDIWRLMSGLTGRARRRGSMDQASPPVQPQVRPAPHRSSERGRIGLISMTGVPSIASIGPTLNRSPEISNTFTRCSPTGLGRSGERVAKTPVSGAFGSDPGCT